MMTADFILCWSLGFREDRSETHQKKSTCLINDQSAQGEGTKGQGGLLKGGWDVLNQASQADFDISVEIMSRTPSNSALNLFGTMSTP